MIDLTTRYMGLELRAPVVVGSSGLTASVEGVRRCAEAGAGAVVLKSVFEEQITAELADLGEESTALLEHPEAREYIARYGRDHAVSEYLDLLRDAKRAVDIPVIPSIHCAAGGAWIEFARKLEEAGADGLELNVFLMPSNVHREGREYEEATLDIARTVSSSVSIPVALKIGPFFSGLANTVRTLSRSGVKALVLFNRFYRFDFDVEKLEVVPDRTFSRPEEAAGPLRWISMLSGHVSCDLVASTGIHDGAGVVKQLLAGATGVQMCSALYENGIEHLAHVLDQVRSWMERQSYGSLPEFRGRMSHRVSDNPEAYERVQFMAVTEGHLTH